MTVKTYVTNAGAERAQGATNVNNLPDIEQPIIKEREIPSSPLMVARRRSDEITSSPFLKRLGIDFPIFSDDMMKQYQNSNVESFNPFVFVPTISTLYLWIFVRDGLAGFFVSRGK